MDQRRVVAKLSEHVLSIARTYLNGQPRTPEGDRFYFHLIDVVHNVPLWLVDERFDPYEMLLQYISYAPADIQEWFNGELSRDCYKPAGTAGPAVDE